MQDSDIDMFYMLTEDDYETGGGTKIVFFKFVLKILCFKDNLCSGVV